jgi:hypothetical protein
MRNPEEYGRLGGRMPKGVAGKPTCNECDRLSELGSIS